MSYNSAKSNNNQKNELINDIKYNFRMNKYNKVLTLIEKYLSDNGDDYYIITYKAMALFRLGQKDESLAIYENIINKKNISKRNKIFALTQYAYSLSKMGKIEEAIHYYKEIIESSNELELIARGKLSGLYVQIEKYDEAIDVLNIAGFNNLFLKVKRADAYMKKRDYSNALKELEKEDCNKYNYYVKENFDVKYAQQDKNYILGHVYYKLGKLDLAMTYLSNATLIKNRTIYFQAGIDMARILILKSKLGDAIKLCEELKGNCTSDYYNRIIDEILAKAYTRKNDYTKAIKQYESIETNDKIKNINLGKIELLKGNFLKAEEYFSYLDINEDNIKNLYDEFYKLALIKFRLQKYDEVEEILDIFEKNNQKFEIRHMDYELNRIRLCIKMIKNEPIEYDQLSYSEKQILSYNKENALNHIMNHHIYNAKTSTFNENIDVEDLFNNISDKMTKENVIYDSIFDKYIIKYNNIGYNLQGDNIHQLLVLTLANTKDIITMYPYDGAESIFTLEELEEKEKPKVKRLSQIEKFNMKYGNN